MSAKRIFSGFIVFLCFVFSTSPVFGQTDEQGSEVKEVPKELGAVSPDSVNMKAMREDKPEMHSVFIKNISQDDDTLEFEVLSSVERIWLRYYDLPHTVVPGDSVRFQLTFSEAVLAQLQQFKFYDTLKVCFTAPGPTVEGKRQTFVDTVKVPVYLKIRPTMTEKMAGWVSKASGTTINIIYLVFLGLFGTWVYFVLRNVVDMRRTKFIGEGVRNLSDKVNSTNPVATREQYLNMLKNEKGSSPLLTCLRNAATECELVYESFENHSESVGKRIQGLADEAPSLSYFHALANVAPAIGFFGTLIGMSHLLMGRALTAGESAEFARYISYFSQGLLQAIVTSIMGLFLLVLSMAVTFVFTKKAESLKEEMFRIAQEITGKVRF